MRLRVTPRKTTHLCSGLVVVGLFAAFFAAGEETGALRAAMDALVEADWVGQDARFAPAEAREGEVVTAALPTNDAGVTSVQDAAGGCDGVKEGGIGFHTASGEKDAWWQVDLGDAFALERVVVYNRTDGNTAPRTRNIRILVATESDCDTATRESESWRFTEVYQHDGTPFLGAKENAPLVVALREKGVKARVVRLQAPGRCSFALDEVEVYAVEAPEKNIALGRPADQKSVGPYSKAETPGQSSTSKASAEPKEAFSLLHSRDVLERASRLAARLRADAERRNAEEALARLAALAGRGNELAAKLAEMEPSKAVSEDERKALYFACRGLLRETAFCNPLLDMDEILFIKRHDSKGLFHMCHQFYGFTAVPGGGLFVLSEPFGPNPSVRNVLENSVVENGRLAGQALVPGTFLSPDLAFDGKTIVFAYTQAQGEYPEWSPRSSYHLFKVNADGTGLTQLTDDSWNDFDPCFLPNGRIAFISERRGGYLRCGGSSPPLDSPTYTLHSMAADGSDIVCLSFHETHEWQPSVNNDGMMVYTRWDYVDRDTNAAHHMWTCYPDGRDPRAFHGNYPVRRESRPWMEMDVRAVPGAHTYVATAAAHHGHAFGSLVLIDPRLQDDGAMAQLTRLTPDVPFPEAEVEVKRIREAMAYGTAWPLSEDDYLCVYDADCTNRGMYWIDRFGNRELVYRDSEISCLSPIPLRARVAPTVLPDGTRQTAGQEQRPATVAVMNVYESDFVWPKNAKVAALRIIQVLPKTTASSNKPRVGVANQTNARAVLGTVPVEPDGSAHFEAPVGKLIYFQAVDEKGMAVQSMRSATYVHPGEHLTCLGCHESKHGSSSRITGQGGTPMALRREPSPITPDVEGSNPFSYARLVQPVLDRACVSCHEEKKALDLRGVVEGEHDWTRSYVNLAETYGFYFDAGRGSIGSKAHGGSRTVAGRFGARAAALLRFLGEDHYGVALSEEDFHRVTLWLDCNSEFFGAYENTVAQARGEVVWPSLE